MKMIILAAGQGTRLRPLTDNKPKCMVEYNNQPIIDYIIKAAYNSGIKDIAIVNGYKKEVLEKYLSDKKLKFFTNKKFDCTNMVSTLFEAIEFMDDDVIISYADIIYKESIVKTLINSQDQFSVIVDKNWQKLWSLRMDDPLSDAETLKVNDGKIIELGKNPKSYDDIEGQYIGLIKISKSILPAVINFYKSLNRQDMYDEKDFDNMYMTSFIQLLIDNLIDVKPVFIEGGWMEIDSVDDLKAYENIQFDIQKM